MMHELIELIGRRGPENGNASLNELGAGRCADLTSAAVESAVFPATPLNGPVERRLSG